MGGTSRSSWRRQAACLAAGLCLLLPAAAIAADYVFGWPFVDADTLAPRGGTSIGAAVTLAGEPPTAWARLQAAQTPLARDRAAILALAGEYQVSFDFLETAVFEPPYMPSRPYRSWATERIFVLESRPDFISLQHILTMFVAQSDGAVAGPFVQKHWRQDWQFEPESLLQFRPPHEWRRVPLDKADARGRWSQSVYQVDDSPRYAAIGRWQHNRSFSQWRSEAGWRPLPRRERTGATDYPLLVSRHRLTVQPLGWLHEQDNLKRLDLPQDSEHPAPTGATGHYRAREIGLNRYRRIVDFDFSAAEAYWTASGPFWTAVRAGWAERLAAGHAVSIAEDCRGEPAFALLFEAAEAQARERIEPLLDCLVRPAEAAGAAAQLTP